MSPSPVSTAAASANAKNQGEEGCRHHEKPCPYWHAEPSGNQDTDTGNETDAQRVRYFVINETDNCRHDCIGPKYQSTYTEIQGREMCHSYRPFFP